MTDVTIEEARKKTDLDGEFVSRLVSSLRQCEADGWEANMEEYGFTVRQDHTVVPWGSECCFLGADMLQRLQHGEVRLPRWGRHSAICNVLGLSEDFVSGFNRATTALQLGARTDAFPFHPDPDIRRGQEHAIAAWQMWTETRWGRPA